MIYSWNDTLFLETWNQKEKNGES